MEEEIKVEKHVYVPEHVKLTEEDSEELLKHYNVARKQLPRILREDPALTKLDVKKGDIIKIIRRNNMHETYFYRVVI
ncbi:MAG: DNA-directed RNA polymerase subunit RpoH/Rpb5 C-terminal domain-containing protein [Nanoarchaeota archaeon]